MTVPETTRVKVAAVQDGPVLKDAPHWFDLEATVTKAVGLIEKAGAEGARLIVFPECWMPAFPYWSLDYGDRNGFKEIWGKFLLNSIEVPSKVTDVLCAAARRANAYVAMGINERDSRFMGRMYNSIVYLSPLGTILGTHRKICNTSQERFFHSAGGGGDNLKTVFKTDIGVLGGTMCGEHSQLTLMYNWIMQGIQIHCSLWPGKAGLETLTDLRSRSLCCTARCFGVVAATYMSNEDMPKKFYTNSVFNTPNSIRGGSGIIDPHGRYIAGPVYDQATIVYADIDLTEMYTSRSETNLTGLYSTWDLLNINVREEAYEPMHAMMASSGPGAAAVGQDRMRELEARMKELERQIDVLSGLLKKGQGNGQ